MSFKTDRHLRSCVCVDTILTFGFLKFVNQELDRVFWLVHDQAPHHILEDLIEALLFDVFLAAALEIDFLLF